VVAYQLCFRREKHNTTGYLVSYQSVVSGYLFSTSLYTRSSHPSILPYFADVLVRLTSVPEIELTFQDRDLKLSWWRGDSCLQLCVAWGLVLSDELDRNEKERERVDRGGRKEGWRVKDVKWMKDCWSKWMWDLERKVDMGWHEHEWSWSTLLCISISSI
jgi:hypothetical protein